MMLHRRLCTFALLTLCAPTLFAAGADEPIAPRLPGGGIVDPGRRTGFLTGAAGGIEAIDLGTGDLLWEYKGASRPVAVVGDRVYAQANIGPAALRLIGFDRGGKGEVVYQSDRVSLPEWASHTPGAGRSFTADWRLERGRLVLSWEARAATDTAGAQVRLTGRSREQGSLGFAHAPIERLAPAQRGAAGRVAFDLLSGKIESLPPVALAEAGPSAPKPDTSSYAIRWQGVVAGNFTVVALERRADKQVLVRREWDRVTGKIAAEKEIYSGLRPIVVPTLDNRVLCIRDGQNSPDQLTAESSWTLVDGDTGELVGRLPYEPGTQALAIIGPRVLCLISAELRGRIDRAFVRPQALRAFDLKSGKRLWSRPIEGKRVEPAV